MHANTVYFSSLIGLHDKAITGYVIDMAGASVLNSEKAE
jgi:hypothetical protein